MATFGPRLTLNPKSEVARRNLAANLLESLGRLKDPRSVEGGPWFTEERCVDEFTKTLRGLVDRAGSKMM